MFPRYDLCVCIANNYVYQNSFVSINQAVKFASGFNDVCKMQIIDVITERIFSDEDIRIFIKELCK